MLVFVALGIIEQGARRQAKHGDHLHEMKPGFEPTGMPLFTKIADLFAFIRINSWFSSWKFPLREDLGEVLRHPNLTVPAAKSFSELL